ncbi:electron transport complex subunit RsxC [Litchfieldella xinjiangensis]|uniref:electron transport complex subunit RsxC n=1 Tax=Litchfieldella xinjiangensis TaxID=1166948 RepID=UPI0005BC5F13|nr:electron transport complex subunit RsxC [Halomonas xinjiangensis]
MTRSFDFPGGIFPPERKIISTRQLLREAALPTRVVLPLDQHIGQAAEPCVRVGQAVKTGEPVAIGQGMLTADLHASITGTVTAIEACPIPHPSQGRYLAVVIERDPDAPETWQRMPALDWRSADSDTLTERLTRSGVVGLGGAGFPTQIKARVHERHRIDTLIVNAAECEPYITADDLLLRTYPQEVLDGARLLARLAGAERILVGIEDNKPEAIAALQAALADSSPERDTCPIEIRVVTTRYPSGGEKQLIKRLLDREVPSGGLPADIGVLCHNPGTLRATLQAVRDGQPLVSRIVTLTGEALAHPGNVEARLGTPIHSLLEEAGLKERELGQLLMGGPLMGFPLASTALPIVKTTNCLVAATRTELPPPPVEQPCIRCGACEEVCPASLLPQQLYWFARGREHDKAQLFNLFDCIECGACAYVCPSHIPLVQYYRATKGEIRAHRLEAQRAEHARHRFEFRQARIEREAAEKEARRQARAKAASRVTAHNAEAEPSPRGKPALGPDSKEQLKQLRIAQAAAKASLRKAEKALARAGESGNDDTADLEVQVATAQENLQAIETRLASAKEASST